MVWEHAELVRFTIADRNCESLNIICENEFLIEMSKLIDSLFVKLLRRIPVFPKMLNVPEKTRNGNEN